MNIEKQLADAVRNLNDKKLAELALKMGFSLSIKPPAKAAKKASNGAAKHIERVEKKARRKKRANSSAKSVKVPKAEQKKWAFTKQWGSVLAELQKSGSGLSSGEIAAKTKLEKPVVVKALKYLEAEKKIHRAGERRFTRYGITKKAATDASVAAGG